MPRRGVRITILVEDQALERFSREILLKLGYSRRELRVTPYCVGQGSAKDWVGREYLVEVRRMRSKPYQDLGLVVGTEADEQTVIQRDNRLSTDLQAAGVAPRNGDERIVLWIPKWNVETWLLYFAGDVRDENQNYKNDVKKPDYREVATAFVAEYRKYKQGNTIHTQPSLKMAYKETDRLGV